MRSVTPLLLLIVVFAVTQPHLSFGNAAHTTTELALYAHTDPSAASVGGRILSLSSNATSKGSADVRETVSFTLVPPLSAPMRILGLVGIYVWLRAREAVRGTLSVAIEEVMANSTVAEIRSASVTVPLPSIQYLVIFGLGTIDRTIEVGSTLMLEVRFEPIRVVPVMLLWDDPSAPTRIVLQVETTPLVSVGVADELGRVSTVFPENTTGTIRLTAKVSVEDPFGGTNVKSVTLSLTNSTGFSQIRDVPMNLTSRTQNPFRLVYSQSMMVPSGTFNVTAFVRDATDRVFVANREIAVTSFYTLTITALDASRRPVPNLTVSVLAGDQPVEEETTDVTGTVIMRLPTSQTVGPLSLETLMGSISIYSQEIEVTSDSALQLELPLYDWTTSVKIQTLNIPIAAARVDMYIDGNRIASQISDSDGKAVFVTLPLGTYDIVVTSPLGSSHFNVTHSPGLDVTLEVSVIQPGHDLSFYLYAAIAVVAVLSVYGVARRRMIRTRFESVAELLGGTIPRAAITMVEGPSGSGKSLLLQNMLIDLLPEGRACVYVSNIEMPSKIRSQLAKMKLNAPEWERKNKLRFVDAYSSGTGGTSPEEHSVSSPTDLTSLGIHLTTCTEELGGVADVFLDSMSPILSSGGSARALEFVRYYGARTAKLDGAFVYTMTPTAEPEAMARLEEASDCVIQIEKVTGSGNVRGRLLIKKTRGAAHEREWVPFTITSKGEMRFLRGRKKANSS